MPLKKRTLQSEHFVKGFMQKPKYADFVTGRLFALAAKDGFGTIQFDIKTFLFKTSVLKRMRNMSILKGVEGFYKSKTYKTLSINQNQSRLNELRSS